jgi:hypothetical protein
VEVQVADVEAHAAQRAEAEALGRRQRDPERRQLVVEQPLIRICSENGRKRRQRRAPGSRRQVRAEIGGGSARAHPD